jgi:hypothetical protein
MSLTRVCTAAFVIVAVGTIAFFSVQARFADPSGTDGYYYLKQIKVLGSGGGYYYKDRSLAFLPPAAIARVAGNPLIAYRFAVALTGALLIVFGGTLTYLAAVVSGSGRRTAFALFLVAIAALGAALTVSEFVFEYYKNAFALVLLLAASLVLMTAHPTGGVKRKSLAFLLLFVALLSHKSSLLFAALFAASWFMRNASRKNLLILAATGTAGVALFLVAFERARQYLAALPSFFTAPGRWLEWFAYTVRNDVALSVTVVAGATFLFSYFLRRRHFPERVTAVFDAAAAALIIAFIPFLAPGPSGPGYRIILFSPIFTVPFLLVCSRRSRMVKTIAAGLLGIFLVQATFGHSRINRHFSAWSSLDEDIMRITRHVSVNDHLIAHHGLEFYVDYRTGIRARQFIASDSRKKSFRLAYLPEGRPGGEARAALERVKLEQIGDRYVLFREEDWQRMAVSYGIKQHWKNPTAARPDYIPDYE